MKRGISSLLGMVLIASTLVMGGCAQKAKTSVTQKPVTLTISAAASLTEAMGEIKTLYKKRKAKCYNKL